MCSHGCCCDTELQRAAGRMWAAAAARAAAACASARRAGRRRRRGYAALAGALRRLHILGVRHGRAVSGSWIWRRAALRPVKWASRKKPRQAAAAGATSERQYQWSSAPSAGGGFWRDLEEAEGSSTMQRWRLDPFRVDERLHRPSE